jgi:peptide/nickel transport system substrate-binding protein
MKWNDVQPAGRGTVRRGALAVVAATLLAAGGVGASGALATSTAAGSTDRAATAEPVAGGTLRFDAAIEIKSWLPYELGGNQGGEDRGAMVFDTLLKALPSGEWVPNLAADMTTTDGITWTMTLRDDVTFTDGTPFDAEAVVFSIENLINEENGSPVRSAVERVVSVAAVDATTVELVLDGVNGDFAFAFTGVAGMVGSPTAIQADPVAFGNMPVGAGPFMVESWERDSTTTLVRNPDYFDAPKPYLDGIEIKIVPDETIRAQDLIAGNADIVNKDPVVINAVNEGGEDFTNLVDTSSGAVGVWPNQQVPPFDDVRVRAAIANAFDYHLVNTSLLLGAWEAEAFVCPPFVPGQEVCVEDSWITPDIDTANALIEEYLADGGEIAGPYRLLISNIRQREGELIQQTLATIGIPTEIISLQDADYTAAQERHDFDLVYSGISPFAGQNPDRLWRNMHPDRRNTGNIVDPELAGLIEIAEGGGLEAQERIDAVRQILEYNKENFLAIWFAPTTNGLSASSDVMVGERYVGGTVLVAQDVWLDR